MGDQEDAAQRLTRTVPVPDAALQAANAALRANAAEIQRSILVGIARDVQTAQDEGAAEGTHMLHTGARESFEANLQRMEDYEALLAHDEGGDGTVLRHVAAAREEAAAASIQLPLQPQPQPPAAQRAVLRGAAANAIAYFSSPDAWAGSFAEAQAEFARIGGAAGREAEAAAAAQRRAAARAASRNA